MLVRLRVVSDAAAQAAEAEMAVGHERPHPELGRQAEGGPVVRVSRCHVGRDVMCGDLPEEAKGPGL